MPRAKCSSCGAKLPAKASFCPECGSRTGAASGETAVQELPATETGPVPVEPQVAQRRIFGVPPTTFLLVLGVATFALAIALFVTGRWPWGLIVLGVAIWLLTGFISQSRRLPSETSGVAQASLGALGSVRARAGAAVETVAAHGSARIELAGLRREVGRLATERSERLRELGEAVYEGNSSATEHIEAGNRRPRQSDQGEGDEDGKRDDRRAGAHRTSPASRFGRPRSCRVGKRCPARCRSPRPCPSRSRRRTRASRRSRRASRSRFRRRTRAIGPSSRRSRSRGRNRLHPEETLECSIFSGRQGLPSLPRTRP